MKPRILLATPVKSGVTNPYLMGLAQTLMQEDADVTYLPSFIQGTYINCARNDFVPVAREHGCSEIIYIDSDMAFTASHLLRLRSHDVEVVGGVYAKRVSGDPQWTLHATGEPPQGELLPVNDVATGFLRVKMSVFDKLDAAFPHRRFQHGTEAPRTEYFPLSLTAKGSHEHPAEATLRRFLSFLSDFEASGATMIPLKEIRALQRLESNFPLPELVGEDCGFMRLCKAAGIKAYADLGCILRHVGEIGYPAKELDLWAK